MPLHIACQLLKVASKQGFMSKKQALCAKLVRQLATWFFAMHQNSNLRIHRKEDFNMSK